MAGVEGTEEGSKIGMPSSSREDPAAPDPAAFQAALERPTGSTPSATPTNPAQFLSPRSAATRGENSSPARRGRPAGPPLVQQNRRSGSLRADSSGSTGLDPVSEERDLERGGQGPQRRRPHPHNAQHDRVNPSFLQMGLTTAPSGGAQNYTLPDLSAQGSGSRHGSSRTGSRQLSILEPPPRLLGDREASLETLGIRISPSGPPSIRSQVQAVIPQVVADTPILNLQDRTAVEAFKAHWERAISGLAGLADVFDHHGKNVSDIRGWLTNPLHVILRTGCITVGSTTVLREVGGFFGAEKNSKTVNENIAITAASLSTVIIAFTALYRVSQKSRLRGALPGMC